MRSRWLTLLLFSTFAVAQAAPSQSPPAQEKPAPAPPSTSSSTPSSKTPEEPKVSPETVVITIDGLCETPTRVARTGVAKRGTKSSPSTANEPSSAAGCKTLIRRAQFEELANALQPNMPMERKRQLAEAYPRLLAFAHKARELGLDKDPRFQQMMKFATLQLLAQDLTRNMQEKAGNIPQAEIASYYKENPAKFEQVELLRIFIPKSKQHPAEAAATDDKAKQPNSAATAAAGKVDPAADEAAMKAEADKIHSAAAAGGDFDKLQKEAFETAGINATAPNVSLGKITRGNLPQTHEKVFDLKAGEVSEIIADPAGFYIYRVVSRQTVPLDQAKDEIRNTLQSQRMQDSMQSIINSVKPELNQAYFGSAPPAGMPGVPGRPPRHPGASTPPPSPK